MAGSNGEKTEKPSDKRIKDARKRGQVARSRDLAVAISSLAVTLALARLGPALATRLADRIVSALNGLGARPVATITPGTLYTMVAADGLLLAAIVGPLALVAAVAGVAGNVAQSGWVVAPEALHLKWDRLSPAAGLSRLKPSQSGIDLVKAFIAVTAIGVLGFQVTRDIVDGGAMLVWMTPGHAAAAGWGYLLRLLWQAGLALLVVAIADHGVQRWRLWSSLKMTKQEVRDESKLHEGNPEIKARVRRIQRDMSRRRMLKAVKQATVVVTNPTHYAVALEYRRDKMAAPVVVAKGRDLMAARIKTAARDHGVPIVENVSLAQALYKGSEIGDAIPAALFGAVAEVLAYLVRIKQLML